MGVLAGVGRDGGLELGWGGEYVIGDAPDQAVQQEGGGRTGGNVSPGDAAADDLATGGYLGAPQGVEVLGEAGDSAGLGTQAERGLPDVAEVEREELPGQLEQVAAQGAGSTASLGRPRDPELEQRVARRATATPSSFRIAF